jgi:RNA polymerase sigma factor (sigma-70 family)
MTGISETEFEKIFKDWYVPVRNYLFYKTADSQAAEDITQDVFLKVWEKKNDIKIETVQYLIFKIATNLFINRHEHMNVRYRFINNYSGNTMSVAADYELEMKEFDEKLQAALANLDDKKRTVFLMNRIDGFTYSQIANILGITVKAVEKRMEKALAFLKERISMKL